MGSSPIFILLQFNQEFYEEVKGYDSSYIEPAEYSFSIWFIIYIGFFIFGIYQVLPSQWNNPKFIQARKWIIINSLSVTVWISSIVLSLIELNILCTLLVFFSLLRLTQILELGKESKDLWEKFAVKLPISIYFGWITLLLPISLIAYLMEEVTWLSSSSLNSELGTVLVLLCTFALTLFFFLRRQVSINYILVVIWGLVGIFVANLSVSQLVSFSALGLSVGLLVTYFIIERQQMEMGKIQMELTALRNQVNPHFLFNNLNTLANLIPLESQKAHSYLEELAKFYRYIVSQREEHLISLQEELNGVAHYLAILKERFGSNLQVEINCEHVKDKTLLPLSLQLLIENAVKHNAISEEQPLKIHIFVPEDREHLLIQNNINERVHSLESTGMGLANIRQRYKHFTKKKIEITTSQDSFCVGLPLI